MTPGSLTRGYELGRGDALESRASGVKASGHATAGSLTVMELTIDGGPPRHVHTREDESFYVFTGTLDVHCGDDRFEARPGSSVFLPRNVPHEFHTVGGPATALLIATPGGIDEYFADLHDALENAGDPARIEAIQEAYGIIRV